ncbi:MAG: hypothetical protein HRU29_13125 [Rhizobiales bacterium]|nr:hypothetical protein [Hyphomicrobiales bacterium]NRB15334.1 hypothetical protein [Hyphomicrobiales bacterium]
MYFSKAEIITFVSLLSILISGQIASVFVFIGCAIYLFKFNNKMRYRYFTNETSDAMLLEAGSRFEWQPIAKLLTILSLWALIWYRVDIRKTDTESILINFVEFWVFLVIFANILFTTNIVYKLFDSSVNSDAFSKREIMLAGSLLIDIIAGIYYFYHWLSIGDHSVLLDKNMVSVVIFIAIFSAIGAAALSLLVYGKAAQTAKDERDLQIEVKAYKIGFFALTILLALIIGQLIMDEMAASLWADRALALNLAEIANYLLLAIMLAWGVVSAAQLFYYRRGY